MKYNIQYKGILIFIAVMTAVFGLYGFNFNTAKAVINKQINYQGKLFTGTNTPVSDGGYNVKYRLYTTATGGSPIWTETLCYSSDNGNTCDGTGTDNRVSVSNGLFSTMLGSVTSLDTVNFNQTLYLSVEIGGSSASSVTWDGEMTPRKKIGAVPAAFEADKLDGLSSEQFIRSDADNATTSSSTFLNVIQNGAGKVAEFIGQSSASVLSILSDGKVGIGTTTPTDVLSVNGPIYLANTSPVSTANRIYANGGSLYYAGNLIGGATVGNWTSNGTDVWRPTGTVGVGTSTPFANFAINPDVGSASNQFVIGSSTATNFIVDNSGNIGVGTASPGAKLHITSTGSPFEALRLQNSTVSQSVDVTFNTRDSGSTNRERARIKADTGNTTSDGKLTFQVLRNLSEVDALTMIGGVSTSEAFVGIGSSSPYAKLSVTNIGVNHSFVVEDSASPDTTPFVIDNAGLVGIGTSTPDTPLTIYSGTAVDKDAISAHGFNGSTAEKTMIRLMNGNRGYNWGIRFGAARDSFGGGLSGDAFVVNTKLNNSAESERFRISKDGFVGIGSTTPFSAALSVYNNAISKNVLLLDALSGTTVPILDVKLASTTQFVVGSSGNVGIGTSSPYGRLSVLAGDTEKIVFSHNSGEQILTINNGSIELIRSGNTSFNIGSIDAFTPSLKFLGTANATKWTIEREAASNPYLRFNSNSANNVLVLGNSGNVGIGSTSPYAQLAVGGRSTGTTLFALDALSGQTQPILDVKLASTSKFMVDSSGNVGIGTTTPGAKLNIAGVSTMFEALRLENNFNWAADRGTKITFYTPYSSGQTKLGGEIVVANNASVSSNDMYFTTDTNGVVTEKMRITNSGNVGIGSTSPLAQLSVGGNSTSKTLFALDALSGQTQPILDVKLASSSKFVIDSSGKVGINTASPLELLDLSAGYLNISAGSSACNNCVQPSGIKLASDASTNAAAPIISNVRGANSSDQGIDFRTYFSGTINAMRIIGNGNVGIGSSTPYSQLSVGGNSTSKTLFALDALSGQTQPILDVKLASTSKFMVDSSGNVGIGTTNPGKTLDVVGNIQASGAVFSDTVESKNSGNLEFGYVNPSDYQFCLTASCATTAMVIKTTSGNVGIGIAAPDRKLHVYGSSGLKVSGYGLRNSVASTNSGFIQVGQSNSLYGLIDFNAYDSNTIFEVSNTYALDTAEMRLGGGFMTFRTGSTFTEKMRITSAGNVGIGLTSPNYKLEVNGTASTTALLTTNLTLLGSTTLQNFTFVNATGSAATTTNLYTSGQTVLAGTTGNVGIGTTTPSVGLTIGSGISYLCPQVLLSTSTSMTVDFNAGCNQIVRMGTSDTTISFTNGQPGQKLELTVCNPTTTSGNITFSGNMSYPGGLAPSHTTTANECDIYNFGVNYATTTAKYLLTGMQSGFK